MPARDGLIQFGEFRFDPSSGEVWEDGKRVTRLQEQPRLVLTTLLSRPHVLVSRDELCRVIWPGDTLVDVENGLNIAINKIRVALRDSALTPRFIETIPRHGYRFMGSLVETAPAVELPVPQPSSTMNPAPRAWHRAALIGSAVLVLAVGGIVWYRLAAGSSRARVGSVAVLPFANLIDRDLDYLVEGLADTVNTALARAGVPRVIARESTNQYRNQSKPLKDLARELRVEAVVRASVVRNGASYAVNVQLVNGATEQPMWTERFERATVGDLTVAADIVADIVRELGLPAPAVSKTRPRPVALEARKEFETGRYFWDQRSEVAIEKAVVHLSRAIDLQPDYAEAWSALADAYALGARTPSPAIMPWHEDKIAAGTAAAQRAIEVAAGTGATQRVIHVAAGMAAARRAIQLDPSLGHPHAALGRFLLQQRRWQESEVEHRQAVVLSPQYSTGRQWYGTLLARLGKCDEALKQTQIGADIDPLTPLVNEAVASVHLMCRQPARAIPILLRVLDMYPDLVTSIYRLGDAYTSIGEYQRALEVLERGVKLAPGYCRTRVSLIDTLVLSGNRAQGTALARQIQKEAAARQESIRCAASASAALGDRDAMFAFLEKLKEQEDPMDNLLFELRLVRYLGDPRYRVLLEEVGLLPYLAGSPLATPPLPAPPRH